MRVGVARSFPDEGEFIGIAKAPDASAQPNAAVRIVSVVFMEKSFCNCLGQVQTNKTVPFCCGINPSAGRF
jgi:hypothetical protein